MSFQVPAERYERFMGRYSRPLAPVFADFAGVVAPMRVLDVGAGSGALTAELVQRCGAGAVTAVDPSGPLLSALRDSHPEVTAAEAGAEQLPFADGTFDAALAQLVVHFMRDPVAGLREMGRVVRPGGTVAACVWDLAEGLGPVRVFWAAVRRLEADNRGEALMPGARRGHLGELMTAAGLTVIEEESVSVQVVHESFEEWWEPYTYGVGPAGDYVASLDAAALDRLREACRDSLPPGPVTVSALAWAARATAPA